MTTRPFRWLRVLAVLAATAGIAVLAAAWLLAHLPLEHATFIIDGQEIAWRGFDAPHAALAVVLVAVALILAALLVSFIVVMAVLAACLGIAISVVAAVSALLISMSPFLLIGWLVWRLLRNPARPAPGPAGAAVMTP